MSWAQDEDALAYHRYRDLPAGTPPERRRDDSAAYLRRLGDDPARDQLLLARDLNPRVPMGRRDRPFIVVAPPGDWMLAVVSHGAIAGAITERLSECTLYAAPTSGMDDPTSCPWTRIASVDDGVAAFAAGGDAVFLVSRRGAPCHRVLAVDLPIADLAPATVVVPEGGRVIEAVNLIGDHLLVRELDGVTGRLRMTTREGGDPVEVRLPVAGDIEEWAGHPDRPQMLLRLASWTEGSRLYRYAGGGVAAGEDDRPPAGRGRCGSPRPPARRVARRP